MEAQYPKVVCDRCGELVYKRAISLENFSKYDLSNKENWVASVMKIEGVTKEVALSWANHGLYEKCNPNIAFCSSCGAQLKTRRAKHCLKCGAKRTMIKNKTHCYTS